MHMFDLFHPSPAAPAPETATPSTELVGWDESFSVGNGLIDGEHKAILRLLNLLYDDWRRARHAIDVEGLLDQLGRMLATHFANEEEVLGANRCPSLAEHKGEHRRLLKDYAALAAAIRAGTADEAGLTRFLKRVVIDHVLGLDLGLKRYLSH